MSGPGTRPRLLAPTLIALAAIGLASALGAWQLQRKTWKEGLIDAMDARLAAAPVPLPAAAQWPSFTAEDSEFRRVKFRAQFVDGQGVYVYVAGSALRDDIKDPGYFAFQPARLTDGRTVVVNRGYVPMDRTISWVGDSFDIVGYLRWPETRPWFLSDTNKSSDTWFIRDPGAMAAAKGWGEVAPFYVDQESPAPPGGVPRPGTLKVNLRNDHFQYALTWFGLALVIAVMFGIWLCTRGRKVSSEGGA